MTDPIVCGFLGSACTGDARKKWNKSFRDHSLNAFFDFYRTKNISDLELRLSEMFHLERRGYVIAPQFQTLIIPLLDRLDEKAVKAKKVDTVVNNGGVLVGTFLSADDEDIQEKQRCAFWMLTP